MKIYLIRHGKTEVNAGNQLQGRINNGLNDEGIKQCIDLREKLKDKSIDLIISSPLERCKKTSEILSDNKIPIVYNQKLIGRDHGEFTGLSKHKVNLEEYWNYYLNKKYEKAENIQDLYNRSRDFLLELKEKYDNKKIAIVTHSGIIKVLYYYFNGIPEDGNFGGVYIENCGFYEYEI
ncbi:MAG: histidine phosphatase family protein [Bacilli bacterium]|nr:histidine phosphatase family protein [Bacilli bacterium]MDD4733868.1 histidine phosphatase family protein [Bacilli bacterium]